MKRLQTFKIVRKILFVSHLKLQMKMSNNFYNITYQRNNSLSKCVYPYFRMSVCPNPQCDFVWSHVLINEFFIVTQNTHSKQEFV